MAELHGFSMRPKGFYRLVPYLSNNAIYLYEYLCELVDRAGDTCIISDDKIRDRLEISASALSKARTELVNMKVIQRKQQKRWMNQYHLVPDAQSLELLKMKSRAKIADRALQAEVKPVVVKPEPLPADHWSQGPSSFRRVVQASVKPVDVETEKLPESQWKPFRNTARVPKK